MIRAMGIMTGTSCDGLDAACIVISASGWEPLWSESLPYPAPLRKRVLAAQLPGAKLSLRELLELHRDLGEWYAKSAAKIARSKSALAPHLIANHGQTISHFPAAKAQGMTLQLGDPSRIARETGLTVVSQFRDGDMAAGGQGAPLVPLFHRMIAYGLSQGQPPQGIAIHNIGGISNVTYLGPDDRIIAFDTGPGNLWIDAAAERATRGKLKMDRGGRLAMQGEVDERGLATLLRHPFFKLAPPKSTGRDDFTPAGLFAGTRAKGADLVATATAVTIESIARAYENHIRKAGLPLEAIYVCGGGAKNPSLMEGLRARLDPVPVGTLDEAGLDASLIEAQAFAMFGFLSLQGQPLGGSWTGARGYAPPGMITPGENWPDLISLMRDFSSE
jgi:anhydro-N-acetylmuramic acid kinase